MNIISNLPEYTKPKNIGLMFFSMEPDKFFPYTQTDSLIIHLQQWRKHYQMQYTIAHMTSESRMK